MIDPAVVETLKVPPGHPAALTQRDCEGILVDGQLTQISQEQADAALEQAAAQLAAAQERLYAGRAHAVALILQGLDASGKDGTIKHVMSGVNPQGCKVVSFKQPTPEELQHDFLWRAARALPARGEIGIFNRSHYEDVLVVRVHPDLLTDGPATSKLWKKRYKDINAFEHHLDRNGTRIVKLFLHLSKDEQKRRFLARLDDASKHWKFSESDLAERAHWDEYQVAYEDALTATSTPWAPWYVVPADDKHVLRALVASILVPAIEGLHPTVPAVDADTEKQIDAARAQLLAE